MKEQEEIHMNGEFKELIDMLPFFMDKLVNTVLMPWIDLGELPKKGIYVFYENNQPIYVGRTNRMRDRIKQHGRPSSTHNSAPFAFNLAKRAALEKGINIDKPRNLLENDPNFMKLFLEAKNRVSRMSVRVIEIDNQITQTIFEVYASIALRTTEYNSFDNH